MAGVLEADDEEEEVVVVVVDPVPAFEDEEHPATTKGTKRASGIKRFKWGLPFTWSSGPQPAGEATAGRATSVHGGMRFHISGCASP